MPFKIMGGEKYYTIKMYGELLVSNISEFKTEVRKLVSKITEKQLALPFLFNFATLRYLDSSGIGALIDLKKLFEQNGIKYGFYHVPEDIIRMLHVTKLAKYFPIFEDENDAIKSLLH